MNQALCNYTNIRSPRVRLWLDSGGHFNPLHVVKTYLRCNFDVVCMGAELALALRAANRHRMSEHRVLRSICGTWRGEVP
jgi:hypothetical protein